MALMAQPVFSEPRRGLPPGQMLGINNPASFATPSRPMAVTSELNLAHTVVMPTSFARSASPGVGQRTAGGNSPAELLEDPHSLLPRFTRVRWVAHGRAVPTRTILMFWMSTPTS